MRFTAFAVLALAVVAVARAEECGVSTGGLVCPNSECCSQYDWCGTTAA
jgi:chitinase